MIQDITTIIWKEWKEIFLMRGSVRSGLLNIGVILLIIGVVFPYQNGPEWLTSPLGLITWSWLPLFLVMGIIADSFAGERERHTLETLLASRLPDRAILFGKIGSAVLYGWSLVVLSMLLGAVTINLSHPGNGFQFYSLPIFAVVLLLSLLAALLMSAIGVLVSLHSATTRQAYQKMSFAFLVLWFVPMLTLQFLPDDARTRLISSLSGISLESLVGGVIAFLIVADIVLIAIGMRQFRRARLILD